MVMRQSVLQGLWSAASLRVHCGARRCRRCRGEAVAAVVVRVRARRRMVVGSSMVLGLRGLFVGRLEEGEG